MVQCQHRLLQHFYEPTKQRYGGCAAKTMLALQGMTVLGNWMASLHLKAGKCTPFITAFGTTDELALALDNLLLCPPSQTDFALLHMQIPIPLHMLSPDIPCHSLHMPSPLTYAVTPYIHCHPLHTLSLVTYAAKDQLDAQYESKCIHAAFTLVL